MNEESAPIPAAIVSRAQLEAMTQLAVEAGAIALRFFRPGARTNAGVQWKGDGSPVTEADYAVNSFLEPRLRRLWPTAAWLSEESSDDAGRLGADHVFVVDPIDGTRGFARGDRHWCIAFALVAAGRPVLAVVHAPALEQTFVAGAGLGATLNGAALSCDSRHQLEPDMVVTCPTVLAKALGEAGVALQFRPKIASLALRIVMVASGDYQAGFTARDSHDWDLAAADLILSEAGGTLVGHDGEPLRYNRDSVSHGALIAAPRALLAALQEALAKVGR